MCTEERVNYTLKHLGVKFALSYFPVSLGASCSGLLFSRSYSEKVAGKPDTPPSVSCGSPVARKPMDRAVAETQGSGSLLASQVTCPRQARSVLGKLSVVCNPFQIHSGRMLGLWQTVYPCH